MIDRNKYRAFLLTNMYGATEGSGGDEVICKCKYCPDNGDHYHMNISIPKHELDFSMFNCWKCHTSGIVTYKRLLEWGVFENDIALELTNHNRAVANKNSMAAIEANDEYIRRLNVINQLNDINNAKLAWINNRLGTNLTLQDLDANNIVLDLGGFLYNNGITNYTRDPRIVDSLSANFLGFLSYDNCFVNLKRLVKEGLLYHTIDKNYINYNIYGKKDNTSKFIMFPTYIDALKLVNVHIAEGPFDALSVKYNLRKEYKNNIYCANTGNMYMPILRKLMCGLGLIYIELHLYLDNDDAGSYTLNDTLNFLKAFPHIAIYIHRNKIGKDMGVRPEEIEESIERIK